MTTGDTPSVRPETLTALLRYFDWAPRSKQPGRYEVWAPKAADGEEEIIVPLNPQLGDYMALLRRAQRVVLSHYGRPAREVAAILDTRSAAKLDATRWKKETALTSGLIGWEEGEALYGAARASLVAAAKSCKENRRYHGNASPYIAKRFLEDCFMGQTDAGSFIITAYTPALKSFHANQRSEEIAVSKPHQTESFTGREIIATFERALRAVRGGLDEYKKRPEVELFLDAVGDGVSYELVKALSDITNSGDSAIEIEREPADGESRTAVEVAFEASEAPVLSKVANTFALDPEPQDVTIVGEVVLLQRLSEVDERVISLQVEEGADVRHARVRLSPEQYKLALEAHGQEALLRVSGSLEKEGNRYWLYHARDIETVEPTDTAKPPAVPPAPQDPLFEA